MLLPPDAHDIKTLVAGEELLLTGDVLTMRDAALKRLEELMERGEKPPFDVEGHLVFHAGPTPPAAGRPCGSIGPTTASRMDRFLRLLFRLGARATLGKGPRGEECGALHAKYGAVYLASVGGVAALMGGMVEDIEPVAWEDLGPEAVFRVRLTGFPAVVAVDCKGSDFLRAQHLQYQKRNG